MKSHMLLALLGLGISAFAQAQTATPFLPQTETASAHLQLTAMFNGSVDQPQVPGMDNAYTWLANMIEQALPEVATGWAVSGYQAEKDPSGLTCVSTQDAFQTEDYGPSWHYHDERTYACEWGNQSFLAVIRVTVTEENATMTWSNTEIVELSLGVQAQE